MINYFYSQVPSISCYQSDFPYIQQVLCALTHHPLNLGAPMLRNCSLKMQEPKGQVLGKGTSGTEKLPENKIWNK